jgi:amino acid adenylation domain-containing protein
MDNSFSKIIGLMTDHNPNLLVGLLGALKSGKGFLPLDPQLPIERLDFLLSDAGVEIIVTEEAHLEKCLLMSERLHSLKHVICLDQIRHQVKKKSKAIAHVYHQTAVTSGHVNRGDISPDHTVYLIYTSGSTGVPKGVCISHRNLIPLLIWSKEYFGFGEQARTLQNLPYYFDFGIFEILTTTLFGGTLYFLDNREVGAQSRHADFIHRNAINVIHSTPSLFKDVFLGGEELRTLKTLHLGGEQLTVVTLESILQVLPDDCVVYNGYGPTEASINSSICKVGTKTALRLSGRSSIPIGQISAHNKAFVLDEDDQPVPTDVLGELCIAGDGLAAGYQNRPDLTAERFIPNLFSEHPGQRLYRTGDLCRHLADGNIEFIRRRDQQVKVRGLRLELGEVEAAIGKHDYVKEAVVAATGDEQGKTQLVGYIVEREGREIEEKELRRYLREKLPEYMIPSKWVKLEKIPLSATGKVNRAALPSPDYTRPVFEETFVSPRNPTEEALSSIWARVLRRERVGVKDDFFELGGQSLLAAEASFFMSQAFQLEIPLRLLFNNPTIEELALAIEEILVEEIDSLTEAEAQALLMNESCSV